VIQRIFKDIDKDNDGQVHCAEFVEMFGKDINGYSGSTETKPTWYHKEMANLTQMIHKLDGTTGDEESGTAFGHNEQGSMQAGGRTLTSAQQFALKKKFGMTSYPGISNTRTGETGESSDDPRFSPRAVPESPVSLSPGATSAVSETAAASISRLHERPRSTGSVLSKHQHLSSTPIPLAGTNSQNHPSQYHSREATQDDNHTRGSWPECASSSGSLASMSGRPSTAGLSSSRSISDVGSLAPAIENCSDQDLVTELRERQSQIRFLVDKERPKSAPRSRQCMLDPAGYASEAASSGRFDTHSKSTVAAKLNRAKKMALLYQESKSGIH
jgi:hypothetical protein